MSLQYAPREHPILRAPRQDERNALAELIMLAGDPPPGFPWKPREGKFPVDLVARRLAMRCESFCLRNSQVCDIDGHVAGMMLGYRLSHHGETMKLSGLCPSLRPLSILDGRLPASFYINTLAVFPRYQQHGVGRLLLHGAELRARRSHCSCLLLEVSQANAGALRFYARHGFTAWRQAAATPGTRPAILVLEKSLIKVEAMI
jgi:ribosomal protein S18 acetylase RimI-like enzyme